MDNTPLRLAALAEARQATPLHRDGWGIEQLLDDADQIFNWLVLGRPHAIKISSLGGTMQLTDVQSFTLFAAEVDGKGVNVPPSGLVWSSDDNGAVVTLAPAADGNSCVVTAVAAGTANVTVTDGVNNLTATDAVTVVAGPPVSLTLTEGPAQ